MKTVKRIAALICCAAMLIAFGGCAETKEADKKTDEKPKYLTGDYPAESENYKVTPEMFAYFFYKDYYDAIEYYGEYYQAYGLDTKKDLKQQTFNQTDGSTWFDYFATVTSQNVSKYLLFAEAAKDSGDDFSAEVERGIENEIAQIEYAANETGETVGEFLAARFGDEVTEEVVRKCLELYYLGTAKYEKDLASFDYGDKELEKYFNENKSSFLYVNYRMVEVRADQTQYATDADRAAGYAAAKEKANYIAQAKNIDEYVERGVAYYTSINDTLEEPLSADEIFTKVTNIVMQYAYNENTDFGKWAFEEGRRSGDITMLDNGAGIYTVYYLESAPYRIETVTKNYRLISFPDEASAKEAYAAWQESAKTTDDFVSIAGKYAASTGALRENATPDSMDSNVGRWLYDPERKSGDCEIVATSSGGYYILYFEGDGEIQWKMEAKEALLNTDINDIYNGYKEKYAIGVNVEMINDLSGENAYTRAAEK